MTDPIIEQEPEQVGLDLKCPGCGNPLTMTDKGLVCPVCENDRKLVVRRNWLGLYKVIESQNVFCSGYLTIQQCEELTNKGIKIHVLYS
jgi:hypothetical protein